MGPQPQLETLTSWRLPLDVFSWRSIVALASSVFMSASCGPTSPRGSKVNKRKAPSVKESGFSDVTPRTRACSTSLTYHLRGRCKVAPRADALGDKNWTIFSLIPMLTPEQLSNCVLSLGFSTVRDVKCESFCRHVGFLPGSRCRILFGGMIHAVSLHGSSHSFFQSF